MDSNIYILRSEKGGGAYMRDKVIYMYMYVGTWTENAGGRT
jgi:hypothetical protein